MREIKFRAWDKKHNRMYEEAGINSFGEIDVINKNDKLINRQKIEDKHIAEDGIFYDDDVVLMQYTGLKDKNGKEIYEGDIIKAVKVNRKGINIQGYPGSSWDEKCNEEYDYEIRFDGLEFVWGYECRLSEITYNHVNNEKRLAVLERTVEHMVGSDKDRYENFEIIGNIYENPELLK